MVHKFLYLCSPLHNSLLHMCKTTFEHYNPCLTITHLLKLLYLKTFYNKFTCFVVGIEISKSPFIKLVVNTFE